VSDFPPIGEILPHRSGMLLLDRVLSHDMNATRCAARPDTATLFHDESGHVPAWLAVEYMAQCLAAHGGLLGRSRGEPPLVGFLVGARGLSLHVARFARGRELVVEAAPRQSTAGLFDFVCKVEDPDGTLLADGRVQCFVQQNLDALRRMGWKEGPR
jgi:predicted hotdog family 3-hydroxylacyl-ACP dehydratase